MAARAVAADFTQEWALPADVPRAGRLLFYPGSSIGNFDPDQAQHMLAHMRSLLGDDGARERRSGDRAPRPDTVPPGSRPDSRDPGRGAAA